MVSELRTLCDFKKSLKICKGFPAQCILKTKFNVKPKFPTKPPYPPIFSMFEKEMPDPQLVQSQRRPNIGSLTVHKKGKFRRAQRIYRKVGWVRKRRVNSESGSPRLPSRPTSPSRPALAGRFRTYPRFPNLPHFAVLVTCK